MVEHILVTHKSWENIGGLPGMLLTLQDTGVPHVTLHGPPGIVSILKQHPDIVDYIVCTEIQSGLPS